MKVAVISDIHENFHNLILFFRHIEKNKVDQVICLGDFINNGIARLLANLDVSVFAVWGNNDGTKTQIVQTALAEGSNLDIESDATFRFLDLDGQKSFLTHYPSLARPMAKSGDFDVVFYGHNHIHNIEKIGDCLIVNPGEISAHKTGDATFALYDSENNEAEIIVLENSINTKTEEVKKYYEERNL
ncbi:MAG: YfcE family phosphodiesterase [Candidatus Moranbacteria bacterium]|nr:YfcE family phosphodiesterase [Candidatus Moranbacteria bacterium]